MTKNELLEQLQDIALEDRQRTKDKTAFVDDWVPDRWFRARRGKSPLARCVNDHVSDMNIQTEEYGLMCAQCLQHPIFWTFPEDRNGPLLERWRIAKEAPRLREVSARVALRGIEQHCSQKACEECYSLCPYLEAKAYFERVLEAKSAFELWELTND